MAITAALAVAIALAFPRLRYALWAYVAAVAFTRVMFGAHFPLDVVAGTVLGTASALLVASPDRAAHGGGHGPSHPTPDPLSSADVAAVMPSYNDVPTRALVEEILEHVGTIVLVDDGSDPTVARSLDELAAADRVELVRLPARRGKGSAVRAGVDHLRANPAAPRAVLVIDADGQHPTSVLPAFLAAGADADLVVGDRFGDLDAMPLQRRIANRDDPSPVPARHGLRGARHAERDAPPPAAALATLPTEATRPRRGTSSAYSSAGCESRGYRSRPSTATSTATSGPSPTQHGSSGRSCSRRARRRSFAAGTRSVSGPLTRGGSAREMLPSRSTRGP